jgi:hypothetical protein
MCVAQDVALEKESAKGGKSLNTQKWVFFKEWQKNLSRGGAGALVGTCGPRVRFARWMALRNSCAGCGFRAAPDERAVRPHQRWGRLRRGSRRRQPRSWGAPRKHIADVPKGAASRARARQSTALQLGFEGRCRAMVREGGRLAFALRNYEVSVGRCVSLNQLREQGAKGDDDGLGVGKAVDRLVR